MSGLAVLGAAPAFPGGLRFVRPAVPPLERVVRRLQPSYDAGQLTNGPLVRELEERLAERLGARHAVAVASCTSGLMLALRAVEPAGPVVMPSFTFSASAHAAAWVGCAVRFSECDPATFQVDVDDLTARLDGAGAVLATHVFGAPCDVEAVEAAAAARRLPLVFDAAHALGATRRGRPVGQAGSAEVFSLSPTKIVVAGEGGIVATDDDDVAAAVRIGRDYANPGDYDTRFVGLNARLSELHAALALESLADLDDTLAQRRAVAARYAEGLATVPGIRPQVVDPGDASTYKDWTVAVDPDELGFGRDVLAAGLRAEGVDTRRYFWPPVHRQRAYRPAAGDPAPLPVTDAVSASVLSLPINPGLPLATVDRVVELVGALAQDPARVRTAVGEASA